MNKKLFLPLLLAGMVRLVYAVDSQTTDVIGQVKTFVIQPDIPSVSEYASFNPIIEECRLGIRQSAAIQIAADKVGLIAIRDEKQFHEGKGRVLKIGFYAISTQWGFRPFGGVINERRIALKGRLYEDGAEIGDFIANVHNNNPINPSMKSSCEMLEQATEDLAVLVANWMRNPYPKSKLGE